MWNLRINIKGLIWRLTAKAIWHQSDAMKIDYLLHSKDLPFHTWLGHRVFGDEGGYRWTEEN